MRFAGLVLLMCAAAAAEPASFEGTTVNASNGQPLAGVHISVVGFSLSGGVRDAYGAMSDATGRFSITGIPAGAYVLLSERRGFIYVQARKGAIPFPAITFKTGEHVADFKLEMLPRAVISGHVVDEFGDPVQNVAVRAKPVSPDTAPVSVNFFGDYAQTDDRGAFRISGAPGKYYLRVDPGGNLSDQTPEVRTDGTTHVIYGTTWYPNAPQEEQAAPIDAKAGGDIEIEIRLARAAPHETHRLTLSGTVHGLPADTASRATVSFQYSLKPGEFNFRGTGAVDLDGTFSLPFSEPGTYRVWAVYSDGKTHLQSQPIEIQARAEVTGLQLNLEPGGEITGSVEVPGDRPGVPREKRTVRIGESSADTGPDGVFHLNAVGPGKYTVVVDPLPQNGCIQSMALDDTRISGPSLDLTHGVRASKLKIAVGIGGQITGAILDKDGQRATNSVDVVVLLPAEGEVEMDDRFMARVDEAGAYSFHGIVPGRYHLVALDLFAGSQITNPDDAKKLAERGELIEVKPGDRIAKDVKVLEPADAKK